MLALPPRYCKPRKSGLTCITDTGLTVTQVQSMLEDYGDVIDIAKFGVGTAYVTEKLSEKINLYQQHNVICYFGGTLFEKFYSQGRFEAYLDYLAKYGISAIEISTGTIDVPHEELCQLVERIVGDYLIFCEVGCKDAAEIMAPSQWINEIQSFFSAGADYVITEGRDSGTAGIYRHSGELRTGLLSDIISQTNTDRVIFEAPTGLGQMYFINQLGANVNLGNIMPSDVLLLEAQRQGLRCETFLLDNSK